MSQQETRKGRIKLVENIEGETDYEKKACQIMEELGLSDDKYDWGSEVDTLLELTNYEKFMEINGKLYEILEDEELEYGFCEVAENSDGSISYIASWYNGGASFSEVLEKPINDLTLPTPVVN